MTISAIVPTCGRPEMLRRAIESILAQTLLPQEIIVVNDTDQPCDLNVSHLSASHVKVISNCRTKGASGARNCGADSARHEFLAFLDDDDQWLPQYLEKVSYLALMHEANIICTDFLACSVNGSDLPEKQAPESFSASNFFYHNDGMRGSNLFISRRLYHDLGGFDETLDSLNDLDLAIRISDMKSIVRYVPLHQRLVRFNNHDGQRLSTPCSQAKCNGVRQFYEKYYSRMTEPQRTHYRQWVRTMWSVDEYGNIVGSPHDAADGTSKSRSITTQKTR